MKTMIKFFAAALVIVAAVSCANEDIDGAQTPDLVHKVFSASLDVESSPRTTLHTDGKTVHWTDGDCIRIIPSGSYSGNDFETVSVDGDFAVFEGETVDADSYRAVYPASAHHAGWSTASTFIFSNGTSALATQYAVAGDFSVAANFNAPSNFAVSSSSMENHLYFRNINAYLKVSLAMDNAVTIEVSSDKVTGSGGLSSIYDLGGTLNYKVAERSAYISSNHVINFKNADGSALEAGVDYYIAIPAVEIEGLKLVVKDAEGNEITSFTKATTFTATANNIYNLGQLEVEEPLVLEVGMYLNSDGSFSKEFVSGSSVAKIFWLGDPSATDTQLATDYPYCTNGLAYEVDENGELKVSASAWGSAPHFTWGSGKSTVINNDNKTPYESRENIHGYSNTVAVKTDFNKGYMTQVNLLEPVLNGKTSSWYFPSIGELKQVGSAIGSTTVWTSTIYSYVVGTISACRYTVSSNYAQQSSGSYDYYSYCRILAF